MSKAARSIIPVACLGLLACMFCLLVPSFASAATKTISPSGDKSGAKDYHAFNNALAAGDSIVLESGGTYYVKGNIIAKSNTSITATGATVISTVEGAFRNHVAKNKYKYNSCQNFSVTGGYWKHVNKNGYQHSMVQFTHASKITIKDATIEGSNSHHAVEFIACKNVKLDNCTIKGIGTYKKTCVEEAVQFDVSSPKTAPTVKKLYGSKAVAGQTCQNMTVTNCTISGCRGLTTNYTKDAKYKNRLHKNLTIDNCTITGHSSEAVALFNVAGKVNVTNSTIVSNSKRKSTAYSIGLHLSAFGGTTKAISSGKYTFTGNTIKGGRQGFFVCTHSKSRFGKVTVKNNKCYAKTGKKNAVKNAKGGIISQLSAKKFTDKKNKKYKW